jgi:putative ABC transport system permease protein
MCLPDGMLKNYFTIALRQLRRNGTNSILNLFGLAIGIACAGLIFLWVEDEWTFNSNHLNKDNIYLVKVNAKVDNGVFTHSSTPGPLAPLLKQTLPGVVNACRTTEENNSVLFRIGDRSVYAAGGYADPSIFDIFTLPFTQGDPHTAFDQLYSIVITESTAKKFFGNDMQVIGKTVRADNKQDFVVTGVIKDQPRNSSLQFEWLSPFEIHHRESMPYIDRWNNFGTTTYVQLKPGTPVATINHQWNDPRYDFTTQRKESTASTDHIFLFGMNNWRLYNDFDNGLPTGNGRIQYVRLFTSIAWIILLIACINFMNLATARSEKRAREVGVRKVLGAAKSSLIGQFIGESLMMAVVASLAAILIMSFTLPAFNLLVDKQLSLGLGQSTHWLAVLLITLICGLIAGSYPSIYLSSFNPALVLKGVKMKAGSAAFIRKGLVVLQFTASIVLVISTIIIYQQIRHVKDRNLGFNKEHLVQLTLQGEMKNNFQVIRQAFIQTGAVSDAALADHETLSDGNNTTGITWPGKDPNSQIVISIRLTSQEYLSTMGMQLESGRNFEATDEVQFKDDRPKDSNLVFHILISASLEKLIGKGSAIGKTIEYNSNWGVQHLIVAGVVKDYLYGDMYGHPSPVIFYSMPHFTSLMYVRTAPNARPDEALAAMESVLKKYNPGYPFTYSFVDEQFNRKFQNETLISNLSRVFAFLAILISCLGLFGLAAYTAERRTKEIGIRKVLGASTGGIARLLSNEFLRLVVIACIIAFPVGWLTMSNWLKGYAYRIDISWWVFALAGIVAVLIALATVSYQAFKAAIANPVKSMRTE